MSTEGAASTTEEPGKAGETNEQAAVQLQDNQPEIGVGDTKQRGDITSLRRRLTWELPLIIFILAGVDISTDGVLLGVIPLIEAFSTDSLIPVKIYMAGFLGAGAYVVTSLVFEPKQSRHDILQLGYRLVGALPLAAGVYLLSDAFVDTSQTPMTYTVIGLAFLAGLYVKLTLSRLSHVAERLSGTEEETQLPYTSGHHRMGATTQLRRGWQQVALDQGPEQERTQAIELLQDAETILDDPEASPHELIRARTLSEEAVQLLEDESEKTIRRMDDNSESSDVSENGESLDGQDSTE